MDTVNVSQTGEDSLEVELTRLGQVSLGAVVVKLEQGRSSLDRGLDHARGGDLGDSLGVESLSEGSEKEGSESHDGGRGLSSELEVSQVGSDGSVSVLEFRPRPHIEAQMLTSRRRPSNAS